MKIITALIAASLLTGCASTGESIARECMVLGRSMIYSGSFSTARVECPR